MNILKNLQAKDSLIVRRIRKRLLEYNQNYVGFISGATGTGKTESALALALAIDPNMTEENVVHTVDEFVNLLNSGKLKKGSCVLFDEYAVQAGARDWYTLVNKVCIEILQTFRVFNLCVLFTAPSLKLADNKTEILLHGFFQTKAIIRKAGLCKIAVYDVIHNSKTGDTLEKAPVLRINRQRGRVPIMLISLAPPWLRDAVMNKSDNYKKRVVERAEVKIKNMRFLEGEKERNSESEESIAEQLKPHLADYAKVYGGRIIIDANKIYVKQRVNFKKASLVKAILEASDEFKQYSLMKMKENSDLLSS